MGFKSKAKAIADGVVRKQEGFNSLMKQLEEPRSFMNLLHPEAQACILEIPEEYLNLDEDEYCQKFKFAPTPTDEALRVNFWMEMDRVKATKNELMNMAVVYQGVCSEQKFWNIIEGYRFDNSMKRGFVNWKPLGYLLTRPVQYEAMMLSLLNISTKKLRDVLSIPLKKENGDLQDPKVIDLILKASAMVDLRVRGNYINRSETKNLTMLESKSSIETKNYTTILTTNGTKASAKELEQSIDEQIKEIEKQLSGQDALPDPANMTKPFPTATHGKSPEPELLSSDTHAGSGDDLEAEYKDV